MIQNAILSSHTKKSKILKYIDILKAVAFVTYKEWAAYRSHMAVTLIIGPLYYLVQLYIWQAIFSTRETLNGLNLEQMLVYFGVAAVINFLIMDFADWNLQMLIHTGKFMTFMLRPVSHPFFALAQKVGHRLLGLWMEFIPVYIIFRYVFKIPLVTPYPFWAFVSIMLAFVMMFLMNYCIGITGFWLTRTGGVRMAMKVIRDICSGVFIPLTFFPVPIQKLTFVLPFQYITYVPIRVFIGSYSLAGYSFTIPQIVGLQALAVLLMILLCRLLWKLGVKRFTGVGT